MKKVMGRRIAVLLSLCLLLGSMPIVAQASGTQSSTKAREQSVFHLGVDGLIKPAQGQSTWSGSKVYFGELKGAVENTPLLWRVLEIGDDTVLLHGDEVLVNGAFEEVPTVSGGNVNEWKDSAVNHYLNDEGKGGFLEAFDLLTRQAIVVSESKAQEKMQISGVTFTNPASEGDKVFLLSAEESSRKEYGYDVESARSMVSGGDAGSSNVGESGNAGGSSSVGESGNAGGSSSVGENSVTGEWWLRSAVEGSAEEAALVDSDGKIVGKNVLVTEGSETKAQTAGILPALYLDCDKVVFTTAANWKKPGGVTALTEKTADNIWKLTLSGTDKDMKAAVTNGSLFERNQTMKLVFNSASSVKDKGFVPNQVSALVLNQLGEPVYYGRLGCDADAATVEWKIPADCQAGDYQLYVFAEQINGEGKVDYASGLGEAITFTVASKETPVLAALPTASGIIYGQSLAGSLFTGGEVQVQGKKIEGSFKWKVSTVIPTVQDSNVTEYDVVFVPLEADKYNEITLKVKLTVEKAVIPAPLPETSMQVDYSVDLIQKVSLPEGWSWKAEYLETGLTPEAAVQAVAVYKDSVNYADPERTIQVTRLRCQHTGATYVINVKEATCEEEGYTGDTCCSACGTILASGETIPKKYHYYYGTRTLKWLGCEQQGEVEHHCICGDAFVEITPALGHEYQSKVTREATEEQEGVRIFICTRCSHSYTEAIPKLVVKEPVKEENTQETVADRMPYVKGNAGISGWNDINRHILKAADGANIQIIMNGALILPEKILQTIQGKDISLQLDMGDSIIWKIRGEDAEGKELEDMNLKVSLNGNVIAEEIVAKLAGERSTMQISFVQEDAFSVPMQLQIPVEGGRSGEHANVFAYDQENSMLVYQGSSQIDANGTAAFFAEQTAGYVIVADAEEFDGTVEEAPEEEPQQPPVTETIKPVENEEQAQQDAEGVPATVIIIIGLVVLGIGLLLIIVLRARSRRNIV